MGPRRNSTMELFQEGQEADIEYFFASDASAIIEHTNRVIYLEVRESFNIVPGCLSPDLFNSSICKVDIFLNGGQFCIFFSKLVRGIDLILFL